MHELKDPFQQKHTMQCIIEFSLFVCFHGGPNLPFQKQDFSCSGGPKSDRPVTFELEVREQNQLGFWNISIRPTTGASFTKIGRPTFSTSGTLSQTMTRRLILMLNCQLAFLKQNIFTFYFSKHSLSFPAQYSIRTLLAAIRKLS